LREDGFTAPCAEKAIPMNPEPSFAEIEDMFHRAMQVPEAERSAVITQHTTGNPALRKEVLSLVQAVSAADRLRNASADVSRKAASPGPETRIGTQIDQYRLDRLLGRGGMGEVYAGHRDSGDPEQPVAIKVIDASLDSPLLRTIFFRERDALARLHHPHIARLLDGGVTGQNSPYLVMEMVGDQTLPAMHLDRYCESGKLDLRHRVALAIEVCSAVADAHRNLIVHGDLKPGNVLVDAAGVVKLVDFGAARLLVADEAGSRPPAFTPAYASPEQAQGKPLTVASDVFSAGKLIARVLEPLHDNELSAIVSKCTQRNPEDRYPTVAALTADLQSWLDHRPVSVYFDNRGYAARKWLRRNRSAAVAIMVVLAGLAISIVQTQRSARKAIAERDRAIKAGQEVEALAHSLLFDFQGQLKEIGSSTDAQRQLATTTLNYLNELSSDPDVTSDALLLDMANAYERMGALLGDPYDENLGKPKEAEAVLQKAVDTASLLVHKNKSNKDARFSLAAAQRTLADVEFGQGDTRRALQDMTDSVKNIRVLADVPDASLPVLLEAASMEGSLGDVYGLPGNNSLDKESEAVASYREGVALEQRVLKIDPANARARRGIAISQYKIANLILDKEPEAAIAGYRQAMANLSLLPAKAQSTAPAVRLVYLMNAHMARALLTEGKKQDALVSITSAHDAAAQIVAQDPLDDRARYDLATTDRTVATISLAVGDRNAARKAYEESLRNFDFMLRRNPDDPDVKSHRREIADSLKQLTAKRQPSPQ